MVRPNSQALLALQRANRRAEAAKKVAPPPPKIVTAKPVKAVQPVVARLGHSNLVQPKPPPQPSTRAKKLLRAKAAAAHQAPRSLHDRLTTVVGEITRLSLPYGTFNAGLIAMPGTDQYICVHRPDEYSFGACFLDSKLRVVPGSEFVFDITNCADPRLIWIDQKLLMVYSSIDQGMKMEYVAGGIIMDLARGNHFLQPETFRISPPENIRQKNWMPFLSVGHIYLVASVKPHKIYEFKLADKSCHLVFETDWVSPWFNAEFMRGNTNPVQLDDGNWLATFHTVQRVGNMHYYDNGCYVFEGKAPFRVLRCSNRTYLRAEDAVEPHFRKAGLITVTFPVGMVREGDRLLISYGDNDSAVKILDTTVGAMLATTLEVY